MMAAENVKTDDIDAALTVTAESANFKNEGRLKKKGKYSSNWHDCYAKLDKDCFVYQKLSKKTGKSKLILLIDIKIDQPEDNSKIFKITNLQKKNSKEKIFQAETEIECQQWMEAIIDAKLEFKEKHQGNSEACSIQ